MQDKVEVSRALKRFLFTGLLFLLGASATSYGGSPASTAPTEACEPESFPYHSGWLGGDVGISAKLPDGRVFWAFGDSFIGNPNQDHRWGTSMISSTVGISHCEGSHWEIKYFWKTGGGFLKPFFFQNGQSYANWPAETFVHNGTLFVLFWIAEYTPGVGLGFKLRGTRLARIDNTSAADPRQWSIQYFDLTTGVEGADNAYPVSSANIVGQYVYLYAHLEGPTQTTNSLIVTRSPINTFGTANQSLQYYSKAGTWKQGLNVNDAKILIQNGASGYTIRLHPDGNRFLATYHLPFFSNQIFQRTATKITGPWSEPTPIYEIPELTPGSPSYNANLFCYGGQRHVEYGGLFSSDSLISYTCNTLDMDTLLYDMTIYVPKVVRVPVY